MAVYQKENNGLTPNAGLGIIDKVLNKFSNHAISNKAVSEEFEKINNKLTELIEGGVGMKCVKFGTLTTGDSATIDLTSLGFTSAEDYYVILNGFVVISNFYIEPRLMTKTATSFSIVSGSVTSMGVSYQVIAKA